MQQQWGYDHNAAYLILVVAHSFHLYFILQYPYLDNTCLFTTTSKYHIYIQTKHTALHTPSSLYDSDSSIINRTQDSLHQKGFSSLAPSPLTRRPIVFLGRHFDIITGTKLHIPICACWKRQANQYHYYVWTHGRRYHRRTSNL